MSRISCSRLDSIGRKVRIVVVLCTAMIAGLAVAQQESGYVDIVGPEGRPAQNQITSSAMKRYGPVNSADTLWRIASATRPNNSVSVYQMMIALYDKNKHAFESENIHLLSRGSIMVVPSAAEARQYSDRQAVAKLKADQQSLAALKPKSNTKPATKQPEPEVIASTKSAATQSQAKPTSGTTSKTDTAQVAPTAPELSADEKAEIDRTRRIQEIQMRQLKDDLADSIGSIETLVNQNKALTDRIESLSSVISDLEEQLTEEKVQAEQALQEMAQQAQTTQTQVDTLIEQPKGASSLWLWLLSGGLFVVFGLIGWLMFRSSKAKDAPEVIEESVAEAVPEVAEPVAEEIETPEPPPEEDVLLDLGLDDDGTEDNNVDLALDELDSVNLDDELVATEQDTLDESIDLLATEPTPDAIVQDIQELDLDLEAAGGELTQDALDALAAMDELGEEESSQADEGEIDLEEAFDAIGQEQPAPEITESAAEEPTPVVEAESDVEVNIDPDDILAELEQEGELDLSSNDDIRLDEPEVELESEDAVLDEVMADFADEIDQLIDAENPVEEVEAAVQSTAQTPTENLDEADAILDQINDGSIDLAEAATPEADIMDDDEIDTLMADLDDIGDDIEVEELDNETRVAEELEQPEATTELDTNSDLEAVDIDSLLEENKSAGLSEEELTNGAIDISSLLTEPQVQTEPEVAELPIDDELNLVTEELEAETSETPMTAEELEAEFDLDNIADELLAENADEQPVASELEEVSEAVELDIDESETVSAQELAAQLADLEAKTQALDKANVEAPTNAEEVADEYLDIDQLLAEADGAGVVSDEDTMLPGELEGLEDLDEEDSVSAKLDLARAYIEIGDNEVATQLLQEIVKDGSDVQKTEASELLTRLT
ncbi:FimV/HubP family polar landmark protein [Echinimonas agarilytica]|uniref:Pilus assembly protein FimV n=1 Tax=Echinimonas agarilytica TaxID=1215918 RepID=A0AA41W5A0_9GAMM|nr:FimV/HubP family polar landmark protein [Echinimonas agarilytica]MCM2679242.1 hypothetical protein [Echinimonas agarilytica]